MENNAITPVDNSNPLAKHATVIGDPTVETGGTDNPDCINIL